MSSGFQDNINVYDGMRTIYFCDTSSRELPRIMATHYIV